MPKHAFNNAPNFRDAAPAWLPTLSVAGFAMAVGAVLLLAFLSYRSLAERSESAALLQQTGTVIDNIDSLMSAATDMETGQRGFLLTDQEVFLEPYQAATAQMPAIVSRLQLLLAGDTEKLGRLEVLKHLVAAQQNVLLEGIALKRAGSLDSRHTIDQAERGKVAMDRIREQVELMSEIQRVALQSRRQEWERAARVSFYVQIGGSTLLLLLIAAATVVASRDYRERELQSWMRVGQMALSERLQADSRLDVMGKVVLEFLAYFLGAQRGTVYALESDRLRLVAGHAASSAPAIIQRGEGLVGAAMNGDHAVRIVDVPEQFFDLASSLGRAKARELIIAPARVDGVVHAVIELGFLRELRKADLEFLDRVSEMLGIAIRSAKDRTRLETLLEETQRQSEELQTQQEELRVSNEELDEQGRLLRHSQAILEEQQAELEQTNTHLEDQNQQLETQRDALAQVQSALENRAGDLERANQYKSEFLANMSHELRTPLNSTLILAKLLADNGHGNLTEEQVKFAETISSAGNDLLALINDILDLSKIEAGKVDVSPESIYLAPFVAAMADSIRPIAQAKQLEFVVEITSQVPPSVFTDRQRVGQILKNLFSNAIKFTERGRITLRVDLVAGSQLSFAVTDTGIGLPEHQHEIIFEAFRQADGSTHRKYGGTGLGLSISRDLARLLGGDITLTSVPGRGSCFTLLLPLQYVAAARLPERALPSVSTPAIVTAAKIIPATATPGVAPIDDDRHHLIKGHRVILVIEDDPAFAAILRDMARELGFQCVVTQSASEGLDSALQYSPEAILLDVNLPDHSGLGVLDQLKRNPKTRHIPVHVMSVADYSREALELGAIGYALKPVKRDELIEALRRLERKFSQDMRRVLVVEDNARQRESMTALLGNPNTQIVAVCSAAEALQQLAEATFDCMVMDLNLPDLSGYELLEKMSMLEEVAFPPVIVYTGRLLSLDEEQSLRRFSKSIILKGARSPERLLDEVTLFLHQVESTLPAESQRMLKAVRARDTMLEGRKVLVVEDDVRNVFALTSVLEPKGAKVQIARNGREALDALQLHSSEHSPIDLILMDIMMPEMDGFTAMREIRKRPEWAKIPIIALTAKAMKDDQEQCLAAGANDYIAKPLDVERLLSLIRVWMPK